MALARLTFSLPLLVATAFVVSLVGCGDSGTQLPSTPTTPKVVAVELKEVSMAQFEAAIKDQKGKVVVVDVWADFCIPCKEEFPHLVELHHKYADKGVVCVSVSVDQPERKAAAYAFLKEKKAVFSNYILVDDEVQYTDRWKIGGPPAALIYDQKGNLAKKFAIYEPDQTFTYKEIEEVVQKLLANPAK